MSAKDFKHAFRVSGTPVWAAAILAAGSFLSVLTLVVTSTSASPAPVPQAKKWADQMPDGEGKKIVVAKCQLCHTLERVVTSHRTKDDWQSVIDLMVEQGASLTDDETKTVVDYLATNYAAKSAPASGAGTPGAAAAGAAPASSTPGESAPAAVPTAIVDPDQTQFTTAPPSLGFPNGVTMAVVSGDPTKSGLFSVLLKLSPDQMIAPHWQSTDVDLVVLRGTYQIGNGDTFDASKLQTINAGEVVHVPAQSHQFGQAKGAAVLLLYGVGPLSVTWGQ